MTAGYPSSGAVNPASPHSPSGKLASHLQNGHSQQMDGRQPDYQASGTARIPLIPHLFVLTRLNQSILLLPNTPLKANQIPELLRIFLRPPLPRLSTALRHRQHVQATLPSTYLAHSTLQQGKAHQQEEWRNNQVRLCICTTTKPTAKFLRTK
jgi:hypothetical protein